MSNILLRGELLIRVVVGCALLRGADVYLIILQSGDLLNNTSNDPSSVAKTRVVKTNSKDHKTKTNRVADEREWEGTSCISPDDGGKDGSSDCSLETKVQEFLGLVGDTKHVIPSSGDDVQRADGSNQEEATANGKLTTDHKSRKVDSSSVEEDLTGFGCQVTLLAFSLG